MRVCFIVGTRPQVIKAAALCPALIARGLPMFLVDTGQHVLPEMAGDLWREMRLPEPLERFCAPVYDRERQLASMTEAIEAVLVRERPDCVLVVGDTNSTLAGARAARARGTALAHVEAGLRSGVAHMPEERNRIETDAIANLLLCPNEAAKARLGAEGRSSGIHVVGDVMLDAIGDGASRRTRGIELLAEYGLSEGGYAIATVHRVETTDSTERLVRTFHALDALPMPVLCPVHPRTAGRLAALGYVPRGTLRLTKPIGHGDLMALVDRAAAVLTDSGGLQKEAYWLGVPCVTLRDETEWRETVDAGWNRLVGTDPRVIGEAFNSLSHPTERPPLYGGPGASARVADVLAEAWGVR